MILQKKYHWNKKLLNRKSNIILKSKEYFKRKCQADREKIFDFDIHRVRRMISISKGNIYSPSPSMKQDDTRKVFYCIGKFHEQRDSKVADKQ